MSEIVQNAQDEFLRAVQDRQGRSRREQALQRITTFSKQAGIQNFLGTLRSASLEQQRTLLLSENISSYQRHALEGLMSSLLVFKPVLVLREYREDTYDLPYVQAWIETLNILLSTPSRYDDREDEEQLLA